MKKKKQDEDNPYDDWNEASKWWTAGDMEVVRKILGTNLYVGVAPPPVTQPSEAPQPNEQSTLTEIARIVYGDPSIQYVPPFGYADLITKVQMTLRELAEAKARYAQAMLSYQEQTMCKELRVVKDMVAK